MPRDVEHVNGLQRAHANAFAALRFDRVGERRGQSDWLLAQEREHRARFLVLDDRGKVLVNANADRLQPLDARQRADWLAQVPAHFLGVQAETPWFVLVAGEAETSRVEAHLHTRRLGLREAGTLLDAFAAGLAAYAVALTHWHANARFCGRCGAPLKIVAAGHRAECEECRTLLCPRTDAAVIVIVEHDGACLLGRQAGWPEKRYSALAGFVEPGETLEHAVCREVHEEAGVELVDVTYHSSQPWPFPASLMVGFTALANDRAITLRDGELEDARWYRREELVAAIRRDELRVSSPLSISWCLLEHWLTASGDMSLARLAAERD